MTESATRRVILRRLDRTGEDASSVASRVADTPGVDVVDQASASSLLVAGRPEAIDAVIRDSAGWAAIPQSTFSHPETRPRVRRPPE